MKKLRKIYFFLVIVGTLLPCMLRGMGDNRPEVAATFTGDSWMLCFEQRLAPVLCKLVGLAERKLQLEQEIETQEIQQRLEADMMGERAATAEQESCGASAFPLWAYTGKYTELQKERLDNSVQRSVLFYEGIKIIKELYGHVLRRFTHWEVHVKRISDEARCVVIESKWRQLIQEASSLLREDITVNFSLTSSSEEQWSAFLAKVLGTLREVLQCVRDACNEVTGELPSGLHDESICAERAEKLVQDGINAYRAMQDLRIAEALRRMSAAGQARKKFDEAAQRITQTHTAQLELGGQGLLVRRAAQQRDSEEHELKERERDWGDDGSDDESD